MAQPDFTDQYNAELDPREEMRFRMWLAADPRRTRDLYDYDLRGAWKAAGGKLPKQGHLTDEFKKPNHPTFSDESRYSTPEMPGGHWQQQDGDAWSFTAAPTNLKMFGQQGLQDYFAKVEPGNKLIIGGVGATPATAALSQIAQPGRGERSMPAPGTTGPVPQPAMPATIPPGVDTGVASLQDLFAPPARPLPGQKNMPRARGSTR